MFNCVFSLFLLDESYKRLKYEENHSGQWNVGENSLYLSYSLLSLSIQWLANCLLD